MIKNICILTFTFFTVFIYSQEIRFQKNHNSRARDLEQSLTNNGDSLILKSEQIIKQVDIFNKEFMKSIAVKSTESKIEIGSLPIGEYIVQARLGRKRIIMYLVNEAPAIPKPEESILSADEAASIASARSEEKKSDGALDTEQATYWVVYESNTGSGSYKTMSLKNKDEVSKMISKNKLELRTKIAKNNTLVVYEVYNISRFIRKQRRESKYYKSSDSNVFNVEPYYASTNTNLSTH